MGVFTDTIKVAIDVTAGQTQGIKGFFSGLKDDIGNAEGAFGKFKAAGSGAMDFVSNNAAGLAAGAGAAIAGFTISAIGDFQELAGEVGNLRDALGLSASDASKWVEVAGDLGIGADTLETAMKKMLQTAGATPQVFDDLGVAIVRAKDGTVDANGTFLSVIDRLNQMKDPAERAAAAQKLLGRAWTDSAELIGLGADGVKARLDEVSGAKIITDDQIAQSREFRDAMDDLNDRLDALKIGLAEAVLPALTTLAEAVGPVIDGFQKFRSAAEAIGDIPIAGWLVNNFIHPIENVKSALDLLPSDDEWHDKFFGEGADDVAGSVAELSTKLNQAVLDEYGIEIQSKSTGSAVGDLAAAFAGLTPNVEQAAERQKDAAEAAKELADNQGHLDDTMADVNAKIQEQIDQLTAMHDQSVNAADATLAVEDAQRKFAESVAASTEVNKDSKSTADDKAVAVAAERDAMIDAAKAAETKAEKDGEASGVAATATQKIDAFNGSLLANAHFATPAAQAAIADYIIEANGIPEEKATDIRAAIAANDFVLAGTLLAGLSAPRQAAIQAEAVNVAATAKTLDQLAALRTAPIRASFTGGPQQSGAIGGTQDPRNQSTVGEYGREVVDWSLGRPKVIPRAESANILGRQAAAGTVINVNVESGDPVKIAAAIDRILWFRNAGPRKAA